jgi:cell division topological specificity factor
VIDFFRTLFGLRSNSGETAKERLRLVLLSDHLSLEPDLVDSLKADLLEVIARYIDIDAGHADITFEHRDREIAMLASVPVTGVRKNAPAPATRLLVVPPVPPAPPPGFMPSPPAAVDRETETQARPVAAESEAAPGGAATVCIAVPAQPAGDPPGNDILRTPGQTPGIGSPGTRPRRRRRRRPSGHGQNLPSVLPPQPEQPPPNIAEA